MSFLTPLVASSSRSAVARPVALAGRRHKADKKAPGKPAPKKAGGPPVDTGDSSTDTLKKELYHPDRPSFKDTAPWQPRRSDSPALLAAILPPATAQSIHNTISHATALHRVASAGAHVNALKTKHELLFAASEELRVLYPEWYELAVNGGPGDSADGLKNALRPIAGSSAGRVEGLFPREMKVPTETPGRDGWDYDWRPAA